MTKNNDVFVFSKTDVSNYVQNKMGLSYLNWAFVVDTLKTNDPDSTYSVKQYPEINLKTGNLTGRQVNYNEGVNGEGAYVTVTVTFRGKSHTESLPCYDFKGKAVAKPDVMLVNKTIKRCYVKAAAMLTGLGISLYINGNPSGDGHNAKRNYQNNSDVRSNRSNHSAFNAHRTVNNKPKQPKEWVLKNIKKQLETKEDSNPKSGKLFKSLYDNRNDLTPAIDSVASMKHCSPAAAAYDISKKYLNKLPKKQSTEYVKEASPLTSKTVPPSSDDDVPF